MWNWNFVVQMLKLFFNVLRRGVFVEMFGRVHEILKTNYGIEFLGPVYRKIEPLAELAQSVGQMYDAVLAARTD